jgi:lipopolysaccharide O-acetyltransferase
MEAPRLLVGGEHIAIAPDVRIGSASRLQVIPPRRGAPARGRIEIREGVRIEDFLHISAIDSVVVGPGTLIASNVFITDHDHGIPAGLTPVYEEPLAGGPVRIGRCCWLGERVCVLRGVTIGDGTIVGAGAVVTRDLPPNVIAAGAPARVVRERA